MKYFSIYNGLRGCYMPDSAYIVAVSTRRQLKEMLISEAGYLRDSGAIGLNQKAIAWLAAAAWKNRDSASGEYVAPYRHVSNTGSPFALGVFTGMTRKEFRGQGND